MTRLSFYPGGPLTANLGYGTTSMMALPTKRDRLVLLQCAFDAGIQHFDTAPYYGYGEAERVLGEFLKGRRDQVTVTTKYGLQAAAVVKVRWVNLLARRILRFLPFLRGALSRQAKALAKKCNFTATEARQSLERSLIALDTDYVDLFLLHEPTFADATSEELNRFLRDEVERGTIRAVGCGGDFGVIHNIASARVAPSSWFQFEDHALSRTIEGIRSTGSRSITFGSFKAVGALTDWLESKPVRYSEWERELACDCRSESTLAALMQASSHKRNPDGIVLFSTRRTDRIRSAARVAPGNQFSPEQLQKFDELARSVRLPL